MITLDHIITFERFISRIPKLQLKALVNMVDRLKKNRTVLADLYNYVQVDE